MFLFKLIFFSFRYTSDVCKHVVQDGAKIELQTLVHTSTKYWWILRILSVYAQRTIFNEDIWQITPHLKRVATLPWKMIVLKNCVDEAQ